MLDNGKPFPSDKPIVFACMVGDVSTRFAAFAKELGLDYNFYNVEPEWANQAKSQEKLMQLNGEKSEIFGFQKICWTGKKP